MISPDQDDVLKGIRRIIRAGVDDELYDCTKRVWHWPYSEIQIKLEHEVTLSNVDDQTIFPAYSAKWEF